MSEQAQGASPAPTANAPAVENNVAIDSNNSSGSQGSQASAELSQEAAAQLEDALAAGDAKEAQKLIRKFKLKVDGKEMEKEIDLSDEDAVRNELQLAAAAKKRMQESSELRKAFEYEMQRLKQDPFAVLQELGLDPDELSASHIERKIEQMKKSPEVLEKERIQEELRIAREESKKLKEEKESSEMNRLQQEASIQLKEEISSAISSHTKLPNTPAVERRMADAMMWAMNNGFDDVSAEDVAPLVEHEMREELNKLYELMPEDALEAFIGRKNIDRLRKKRIAQVKAAPASVNDIKSTTASTNKPEAPNKDAKKISAKDFFRR